MLPTFFETHCHLNHRQFHTDREEAVERARAAGVRELLLIGYDLPSSREAAALARPHHQRFFTAGIHPHEAETWNAETERELRELLRRPGALAVGEIGLDFYRDLSPRAAQYAAFRAQLDLAAELALPIVVHTRESITSTLDFLEPYARGGLRGVLHCWSGTPAEARRALEQGFHLGIGGVLTYKNPGELPVVAAESPLDRLLLETDCPYLTPVPHRGKRNEPAYLPLIAERLAAVRGVTVEEVAAVTRRAAAALFRTALPEDEWGGA